MILSKAQVTLKNAKLYLPYIKYYDIYQCIYHI